MNEVMKPLLARLIFPLLGALLVAGCSDRREPPLHGARIGGPFTLTAQDGRSVSDTDFAGRYRLIYFGYSYCPDVCPTDLLTIGQGLTQFEKADPVRAARVQPIFITIDPERDTPAVLKDYAAAFHPRLIGLSGPSATIAEVAQRYGIFYTRQPQAKGASGYLMDHNRQAVLFGPRGEPIALLPQDEGAKAVAAALEQWVQ
jgi:protein SCO1/2